jgi:hypothetical protein
MKCNACGFEFEGKFCTNCGTAAGQVPKTKVVVPAQNLPTNTVHGYKVENVVIKAGVFTDAQDLIPKKVQPLLDLGTKKGWRLHTFTPTISAKGINICLVWEI